MTSSVYLLATTLLGGQGYDYSPRWSDQSAGQTPSVSADQRTVTVSYDGGACDEGATADVAESDSQVKITVQVTESGGDCSAMAVPRSLSVHLAEPLGDRELVDGGTD